MYRLRAFVHYKEQRRANVSDKIDGGHCVAYFRSGDAWYCADDQDVSPVVRAFEGCPTQYPYICFLERVGEPESVPESINPHEVCELAGEYQSYKSLVE